MYQCQFLMKNALLYLRACLCSWLQQDTSCPTCRMALAGVMGLPERAPPPMVGDDLDMQQFPEPQQQGNQRYHYCSLEI